METINHDCKFRVIGIYHFIEDMGWTLFQDFENDSSAEIISLSIFDRFRLTHIRDTECWLWDFNYLTRESADNKYFRVKVVFCE